jgi:hypothetical protein
MNEQTPQPRKILRVVIGVVLVVGMAVGYWAMGRQRIGKQASAAASIKQLGGHVYLEHEWRDGAPDPEPTPPADSLARRMLGSAWLDRVVAVELDTVDDLEQAVRALRWLPDLEFLNVTSPAFTDEHTKALGRITSLRSLRLAETRITDASVPFLKNLRLLKQLDLRGTEISAAGVKLLRRELAGCEILY